MRAASPIARKLPIISAYANDDDFVPLTETALWRRLRPAGGRDAGTEPAKPVLDLTSDDEPVIEVATDDFDQLVADLDEMPAFEPIVIDLNEIEEPPAVRETNGVPPIDATLADDVGRPVAVCQHCGGFGQRDLFDRFSRTEYFSCDDCGHMWQRTLED